MRKRDCEVISENDNGDWIEVNYNKKGVPEFYVIYFSENSVAVNLIPEAFKKFKELFWSLTKDLDSEEEEDF